jgi:3-phosphoshikimate 1-carboxyvinyltransferase
MGADIRVAKTKKSENVVISGEKQLIGKRVRSFGDHRTAMSMIIAGLAAKGKTIIDGIACINKSFPAFLKVLNTIIQ